ncbi:MAG: threonine synthase, partial [bacterium]
MRYISTRGGGAPCGFQAAVMTGLARDGGLLLPANIPDVSRNLSTWSSLGYAE